MGAADLTRPIRILELRSVRGTGGGPEKTILLGSARSDTSRFPVLVCYIRDARDQTFAMATRARELGVNYLEILERHSWDRRIWPKLVDLVRKQSIDLVHAHDYKTDFLALLLARKTGIIPLATVHGWIRNTWRERLYYMADTKLLGYFPAVIAVSGPIKEALISHGARADRVIQVPNGVDHREYCRRPGVRERLRKELAIAPDSVVVGAVGRLEAEKRFDILLDAVAAVEPLKPEVILVGSGSRGADIARRAEALGLTARVRLLGQRTDVRDLLHAFDVYVQTSDTEGIPNVVLEAMATEVPVVATRVGGTPELIVDGVHGLLVPPGDATIVAAALGRTLAEPTATARRVAAARARVERELSFDARMEKVEAVYADLFRRRRGSKEAAA
jgi:glycosyltransferase involved in cell wall biosynthesis